VQSEYYNCQNTNRYFGENWGFGVSRVKKTILRLLDRQFDVGNLMQSNLRSEKKFVHDHSMCNALLKISWKEALVDRKQVVLCSVKQHKGMHNIKQS
jgi:hypothetical protein